MQQRTGKANIPGRKNRGHRKAILRMAKLRARRAGKQELQNFLKKLRLPGLVMKMRAEFMADKENMHLPFTHHFEIVKKIIMQLEIPESKKKIAQKLFAQEMRVSQATILPIPRQQALEIIKTCVRWQRTELAEKRQNREQIALAAQKIRELESTLAQIEKINCKEAIIQGETAFDIMGIYDLALEKILGEENYSKLSAALEKTDGEMQRKYWGQE